MLNRAVLCLLLMMSPLVSHAVSEAEVSAILKTYFSVRNSAADLTPVSSLPATPQIIFEILQNVRQRLAQGSVSVETQARADHLVSVVGHMAVAAAARSTGSLAVPPTLVSEADAVLRLYSRAGEERSSVLAVFDNLALWSPAQLWFFQRLNNPMELEHQALRIARLIPQLGHEDRLLLADHLRQVRGGGLVALCLLFDLELERPEELSKLFENASLQFARAIARGEAFGSIDVGRPRFEIFNQAIAATLSKIAVELANGDEYLEPIFEDAVTAARKVESANYDPEQRLLFFEMMRERSLDWADRIGWIHRGLRTGGASRAFISEGRYEALGANVLKVNFGGKKNCSTQLEKPKPK